MTSSSNKASSIKAVKDDSFAEVIESSLTHFTAQCWQWNVFPRFASLIHVKQDKRDILGLVTHISTGSMDPMRYPFPYQKTEQELLNEQPQIFEFLKTTFQVLIVGYQEKEKIKYLMPNHPCKIHAFVQQAPIHLINRFFSRPDFLHLLFNGAQYVPNLDEMLLSLLHELSDQNVLTQTLVESYYQTFSLLTGNDYRRLKIFLSRAQGALKTLA